MEGNPCGSIGAGAQIRRAGPENAATLSVLTVEVWLDTYAPEGIPPAFAAHLVEEHAPDAFRHAMATKGVDFLLSCQGDRALGYAKLLTDPAQAIPGYGTAELATLYVRRHHKRQGVGRALLAAALDRAGAAGHRALHLTVHHANRDAIAFYEARHFRKVGDWIYRFNGFEVLNLVMARTLA